MTCVRATIRTATAADYPAFTSLFGELGLEERTPSVDRWTRELMFHTLVAEHAGAVRGYVSFCRLGKLGHVRNLVVSRDARNAGVGKTLLHASAASLRAAGAVEWHLHVRADNAAAIRLYEAHGYRALGQREDYYQDGAAALRYSRRLRDRMPERALPAALGPVA